MASGLTASDIVRLFEEDVKARRRLAELLVMDEDVRLALINAVLRDVATKHDLERLRAEFRAELGRLESRIDKLEERLGGVERELSALRERMTRVEGALTQIAERIGDLDKRIDLLEKSVDKRMEEMSRRIDELGKRMDYIARMTMLLAGSVVATLLAAIILRLIG